MSGSAQWFERAKRVIPGGVNSPVRAFKAVGGNPPFIDRGEGASLFDVEGHPYLDLVQSWGALVLGHADRNVLGAVTAAASRGSSYGAPTPGEVRLAEAIRERVPSLEQVRLCSSGTEATMHAIRLARGVTGRDLVLKMAGCYHGAHDAMLVSAGSGVATLSIPGSAGVPEGVAGLTRVVPYNELDAVVSQFERDGDRIAAVIVEPVAGNMGVVLPVPGYLAGLREVTQQHGALLVFDEVITGFRVARGGAQQRYAVTPDLTTLGKILGGGFPLAAFGGRADLMGKLAPEGPVYQAGTLSGNPVAVQAGLATIEQLDEVAYDRLEHLGAVLEAQLSDAATYHGCSLARVGSMFTVFFRDTPPRNYDEAKQCDVDAFGRFHLAALNGGVYLPPSQFEASFLSLATTDTDLEQIVEGLAAAMVASAV